jgi:hypothetical protein
MFVSSPVANSSVGGVSIQMPEFCPWLDFLIPFLFFKEAISSPQFLSDPFENMLWSKTPVVTHRLAITPVSLRPSVTLECVGFPPAIAGFILMDHTYTFFGAQYRACNLVPPSFRPPSPVLPVDFTNELPAKLCSCGTFTHWVTSSNFILLFG